MKMPSVTQVKILKNAAGIAKHSPFGKSEAGGWSAAYMVCRREKWTDRDGKITEFGRLALKMVDMPKATRKFVESNLLSPVVEGAAYEGGQKGGYYVLADGRWFAMNTTEMRALPEGFPRWVHDV